MYTYQHYWLAAFAKQNPNSNRMYRRGNYIVLPLVGKTCHKGNLFFQFVQFMTTMVCHATKNVQRSLNNTISTHLCSLVPPFFPWLLTFAQGHRTRTMSPLHSTPCALWPWKLKPSLTSSIQLTNFRTGIQEKNNTVRCLTSGLPQIFKHIKMNKMNSSHTHMQQKNRGSN